MKKSTKKTALKTGTGILTAAALAAGAAYLLSTDEGKKRTKQAKAWVQKARKQIADNIKKAQNMTEEDYKKLVTNAVKRHGILNHADMHEMGAVAKEMHADWSRLRGHARKMAEVVRTGHSRGAAKPARKAASVKRAGKPARRKMVKLT